MISSGCSAASAWSPVADIDVYAAAVLDDITLEQARRCLDQLYDQHLIASPHPAATSCMT